MIETLLSVSEVTVFGERVTDMIFTDKKGDPTRYFVRVYGYQYEGNYYALDAPIIMLLVGLGKDIDENTAQDVKSALPSDIKSWVCDKSDKVVRLDEWIGSVEEVLLNQEIGSISGGRVSGGRVSGGRVSGGRVSGGRVSGVGSSKND